MHVSELDRRISFKEVVSEDGGLRREERYQSVGSLVWAKKTDVSDGEKFRAGQDAAWLMCRFVVRWNSFTSTLTPSHRLMFEGEGFDILGIKEIEGRRRWLEFTAIAKVSA